MIFVVMCLDWLWLDNNDCVSVHLSFNFTLTLCISHWTVRRLLRQRLQESFQDQGQFLLHLCVNCIFYHQTGLSLVHTTDATTQDSFVSSPIVFTASTRHFCLVSIQFQWVRVGGVNTIGDKTKLSCVVELVVWTQLQTRQDSFVSFASAVWTSH